MEYAITPLTRHTGAEVCGVLVIRGQHFTPPQFIAAAQVFGELFQHDKREMHVPGYPQIYYVSNEQTEPGKRYISGETFHTDHSNNPAPPKATMLFPVSLPSYGGDTQYVNMHQAYDDLPATTKGRIDGLNAVHVYLSKYQPARIAAAKRGQRPSRAAAWSASAGPHPSRKSPQGALSKPGADRINHRHGGQGSVGPCRRADAARHPEEIRIPPPMALRRLRDLGQPQRHSQGESGLRHERAMVPLPPDAERRDAGVIGRGVIILGQGTNCVRVGTPHRRDERHTNAPD
jgi:hypothetical protein